MLKKKKQLMVATLCDCKLKIFFWTGQRNNLKISAWALGQRDGHLLLVLDILYNKIESIKRNTQLTD